MNVLITYKPGEGDRSQSPQQPGRHMPKLNRMNGDEHENLRDCESNSEENNNKND